mgnify:FL=1
MIIKKIDIGSSHLRGIPLLTCKLNHIFAISFSGIDGKDSKLIFSVITYLFKIVHFVKRVITLIVGIKQVPKNEKPNE